MSDGGVMHFSQQGIRYMVIARELILIGMKCGD